MVLSTSARMATAWGRLRYLLLAFVILRVAHDAAYLAAHGPGGPLHAALSQTGHDAHGLPTALAAIAAAVMLATAAAVRLALLASQARDHPRVGAGRSAWGLPDGGYPRETARLWLALAPVTTIGFVVQEALERWLHEGSVGGALAGESPVHTLLIVGSITLVGAAVGALVRLRIRQLEARIAAAAAGSVRHRPLPACPPSGAWIAAALCATHWTGAVQDPGRAPPLVLAAR